MLFYVYCTKYFIIFILLILKIPLGVLTDWKPSPLASQTVTSKARIKPSDTGFLQT